VYAVIKDGKFTGTVYDSIKKKIIEHHNQYDEIIVKIDRKFTHDDDGNVVETPTEKEFNNRITEIVDENEALKNRLEATEMALITIMME